MKKFLEILNYSIHLGKEIRISIKSILILIVVIYFTSFILRVTKKFVSKKLTEENALKFTGLFSFFRYFIYITIALLTLSNLGVNITAILTGAAALLIGVGLALQTFFQDIISGIFMLIDQTVRINDIIEYDNKIVRVTAISLRTTKAITIENKILVIPNHLYLTNTVYNWTQNGVNTRESVNVGVAYGSDVQLVKQLLLQAAKNVKEVINLPEPAVLFLGFGDSSLDFRLVFTTKKGIFTIYVKSDLHFEIDRLFRAHNVTIPFPQRDVHIFQK